MSWCMNRSASSPFFPYAVAFDPTPCTPLACAAHHLPGYRTVAVSSPTAQLSSSRPLRHRSLGASYAIASIVEPCIGPVAVCTNSADADVSMLVRVREAQHMPRMRNSSPGRPCLVRPCLLQHDLAQVVPSRCSTFGPTLVECQVRFVFGQKVQYIDELLLNDAVVRMLARHGDRPHVEDRPTQDV